MLSDFHTQEKANEGIKVPLSYPDGTPSKHYLIVRSSLSDHYRKAEQEAYRKGVEVATIEDKDEREKGFDDLTLEALASLIAGWSFEDECSQENIVNWLRNARQIAEMIDKLSKKKQLFFKRTSTSSESTQEKRSS